MNRIPYAHTFHVPVMGVAFTIDTPIKVAHLGISSVISMVDDGLMEQMREYYSKQYRLAFEEISAKVDDFRAKRVTAYLNTVQDIVTARFESLKQDAFEKGTQLERYIRLLPDASELRTRFHAMLREKGMGPEMRAWIEQHLKPGSIDINIMTKLDKENSWNGEKLPSEFNDAHAALRGFANSKLESSVVLSAGLNPRLYSYFEQFKDFFPDAYGRMKKKIILKISDYRSALVQGKFFAKKGLWVSEFRMESGLNCGGHAFATDGLLMGPILNEFRDNRESLQETLFAMYADALRSKGYEVPATPPEQLFTAQGGVGNVAEHEFLMEEYGIDSVGWGSPFLLVPEVTTVDQPTIERLCQATENDLYLSHGSPLGVRFNNLRNNSMSSEMQTLIDKNRPGSPCPKKFSVLTKEYTEETICMASRQYQHLRLQDLEQRGLSPEQLEKEKAITMARECLCVGLTNSALMNYGIPTKHYKESVSICPGPNLAYYDHVVSLEEMVDHIYGRTNIISRTDRPHFFLKELGLYIQFFAEAIDETPAPAGKQRAAYLSGFRDNLFNGMIYYRELFGRLPESDALIAQLDIMYEELNALCADTLQPMLAE